MTNFNNSLLQHRSFILRNNFLFFAIKYLFFFIHERHYTSLINLISCCSQRILSNQFNFLDHSFEWVQYQLRSVLCKLDRGYSQHHYDEKCLANVDEGLSLSICLLRICSSELQSINCFCCNSGEFRFT